MKLRLLKTPASLTKTGVIFLLKPTYLHKCLGRLIILMSFYSFVEIQKSKMEHRRRRKMAVVGNHDAIPTSYDVILPLRRYC